MNHFATASFAAILLAGMGHAGADTLEGKEVGITDGDTITVLVELREVKVRVAGIDAPEKKQAFGQRSKEHLSECAFGKAVSVEWTKTDRYGRTIGKVTAYGVDCGLRQIQNGMAWHYKAYAKEQTPVFGRSPSPRVTGALSWLVGLGRAHSASDK